MFAWLITCGVLVAASEAEPKVMLLANRKDIRVLDMDRNLTRIVVDRALEAVALSFIYSTGTIYWSEAHMKQILRAPMPSIFLNDQTVATPNSARVIFRDNLGQVDGIACDWITMKLYWTDSYSRRIEVADVEGNYRKVILWTDMGLPRSITVLANRNIMFWSDWGDKPKLERASMDGTDRRVIVREDIGWPNGVAVDPDESRLYFSDARISSLFSTDLDGNHRTKILKYEGHPYSVVILDEYIYWTDWQNNSVFMLLKNGMGSMRKAIQDTHLTSLDIKFFDSSQQKANTSSPCLQNNGGCSALCLLSTNAAGMSCACPTGIRLQADGKTCDQDIESMFFVARKVDIRAISLDTLDFPDMALPLTGLKHAVAVDFDPLGGFVYWTDDEAKTISRARLNGSDQEVIINKDIMVPDGIAIDPVARNIYFTDAKAGRIHVAALNGSFRKTIISSGLSKPRGIAVDSKGGRVYWTDWGVGVVERSFLNGSNRETLVQTPQGWPNGITLDVENGKIYWGDAKAAHIEEANMDGTGRVVIVDKISHIFGLALFDGYLYWSEWKLSRLERFKLSTHEREVIVANLADTMLVWAGNTRPPGPFFGQDNPCYQGGGCSHFCLNSPHGKLCACPDNMNLTEDGRSCDRDKPLLLTASADGKLISGIVSVNKTLVNVQVSQISGDGAVGAIDFYWPDKSLFFVDTIRKMIYRTSLDRPHRVEAIVKTGLSVVSGLSVDWLAGNLYWADSEQSRIEVSRLNGAHRRVILWESMKPTLLVVDPIGKQLYWVDELSIPRIDRSRLDGKRRVRLVELKAPATSFTLDPIDRKLYWSDEDSIESVELTGKSKRVLYSNSKYLVSHMAVYGGKLFLSNETHVWTPTGARNEPNTQLWQRQGPRGICGLKVLQRPSPLAWNQCALSNGECQALCFAVPSEDKSYQCACETHYELQPDGKCVLPPDIVLFAEKNSINRVSLDGHSPDITLPIKARNVRSLHFDPYTNHILWLEVAQEQILRARDDGSDFDQAFKPPQNDSRLIDFTLDPLTGQLFWICGNRNTINVARLMPQGKFKQLGVIVSVAMPRFPAVHQHKSLVVFMNLEADGFNKIMSCSFDGNGLRTVYSGLERIKAPTDLVVDTQSDLIIWADSSTRRVEAVHLDGDRHVTLLKDVDMIALAVYEDIILGVNRKGHRILTFGKTLDGKMKTLAAQRTRLVDLFVLPSTLPVVKPKDCSCSHVCLVHGQKDVRFSCSCPLQSAEGLCDVATCSSNEFTCRAGLHRCISQAARCDGTFDCGDGSDEFGCCAQSDNFKCLNNENLCIYPKKVCDGHPDCPDGSDESNCENDCHDEQCCQKSFRCQKSPGKYSCLPPEKICNGESDCSDKTDELSCCLNGMFQCHDRSECIQASKVCDGFHHCADKSDEFSCCTDNCKAPTGKISDISSASESSGQPKFFISSALVVIVIILAATFFAKRDTKVRPPAMTVHYQTQQQTVTPMNLTQTMRIHSSAPPSATSSDPKTTSSYPHNPPPSPATVQSFKRSGPSSTCSSGQNYMGSEASFLFTQRRNRVGKRRPNTPCSDELEELYNANHHGYVPPPASPIPTEKCSLYSDPCSSTHHDQGFI